MHVSLDFTAPFEVGDTVFTAYPPQAQVALKGHAIPDHVPVTISAIKIVFELAPDNGLVVTQPTPEKTLTVRQLVYTLLPDPALNLSAFMVECSMEDNEPPKLYATEAEFLRSPFAHPAGTTTVIGHQTAQQP